MCHYCIHEVGRCSFLLRGKAPIYMICSYSRSGNSTPLFSSGCCQAPSSKTAMGKLWFGSCVAFELSDVRPVQLQITFQADFSSTTVIIVRNQPTT